MTATGMHFEGVHRLIKRADSAALNRALAAGLDPNLSNQSSWTLLMLAALEGNLTIGRLLASSGAAIDATNVFGETALSLAAHKGHMHFVRWLIKLGASTRCRPHGWDLADWIEQTSGLRPEQIKRLLIVLGRGYSH